MKQRFTILGSLFLLIVILIGLNAISFVQKAKEPDREFAPNRSSYNSGATGTRAFYTMLAETGRQVTRWQRPPEDIKTETKNKPAVFIVIGPLRREFSDTEATRLLEWVSEGGRLIVIDRDPPPALVKTTANWEISFTQAEAFPQFSTDPANQAEMSADTLAARPRQPTIYSHGVIAAQPSRFASSIRLTRPNVFDIPETSVEEETDDSAESTEPEPREKDNAERQHDFFQAAESESNPEDPPANSPGREGERPVNPNPKSPDLEVAWFKGPVSHFTSGDRMLLVDVPYGAGEIAYLSDPFVVANGGIDMADNARLAMNLAASRQGLIAFDEYHHGFGAENNRILEYFESTPVTAIFLQLIALAAVAIYSQGRRFARHVPMPEPDRRSKLEYISAMAELQQRTRAFDLAIENIYSDFRRRAARHFGLDGTRVTLTELASSIAERTGLDRAEIEQTLRRCEDIIHGEAANKNESLRLAKYIRQLEELLRLRRSGRAGK